MNIHGLPPERIQSVPPYGVRRQSAEAVKKLKPIKNHICKSLVINDGNFRFSAFDQFFHSFASATALWRRAPPSAPVKAVSRFACHRTPYKPWRTGLVVLA